MKRYNLLPIIIFFISSCCCLASSSERLFEQGNEAYIEGDYKRALSLYEACTHLQQTDNLYLNISQAHLKLNQAGHSIYYLDKILLSNPRSTKALSLLDQAYQKGGIQAPSLDMLNEYSRKITLNTWIILLFLFFWGFVLFVYLNLFCKFNKIYTAILLVLIILSVLGVYTQSRYLSTCYILNNQSELKLSPTDQAPVITFLQAGQSGHVISTYSEYSYIQMKSQASGWVKKSDIKKIYE